MSYVEHAEAAAEQLSKFINSSCAGGPSMEEFIKKMGRDHRTLQQGFTRLCVMWFVHLSEQEHCDARNEASVKLGKKFVENIEPNDLILPFI